MLGFNPLQAGLAFFPMTVVNFIVALAVPWLGRRIGGGVLLTAGVALTLTGMLWLSQVGVGSDYLTAVALPMVLIDAGQGLAFAALTSSGIAGVSADDAGAASGLVNTAHQLGSALGLAVLLSISSGAVEGRSGVDRLAHGVSAALSGGSTLLAICLVAVVALVLPATFRSDPHPLPATLKGTS